MARGSLSDGLFGVFGDIWRLPTAYCLLPTANAFTPLIIEDWVSGFLQVFQSSASRPHDLSICPHWHWHQMIVSNQPLTYAKKHEYSSGTRYLDHVANYLGSSDRIACFRNRGGCSADDSDRGFHRFYSCRRITIGMSFRAILLVMCIPSPRPISTPLPKPSEPIGDRLELDNVQ